MSQARNADGSSRTVPPSTASVPSGAELRINGEVVGQTDFAGQLAPGSHKIVLARRGYDDLETTLRVSVAEPEVFSFNLVPGVSATEKRRRTIERLTRWSLTGLAAAATAVWAWQGLRAHELDREAERTRADDADFANLRSGAKTASVVADVSLTAAVLSAAGATYFWLTVEF